MDVSTKKIIKKTNPGQFKMLVQSIGEFPELATSNPIFGKTKFEIEGKWDLVAQRINAIGPSTRSASDWKKIWADLKCRTKAKISENAKQMKATGGGPSCSHSLTDLENDMDRICQLSAAVPLDNNTFGVILKPKSTGTIDSETVPSTLSTTVAFVTPPSSEQGQPQYTQTTSTPTSSVQRSTKKPTTTKRKRKNPDELVQNIQIRLLKSQVEQNEALVHQMKEQTKALCGIENTIKDILMFLKEE